MSVGSRLLALLLCATVAMTVVVSIGPISDALAALVHCRGGELVTERTPEGSVPVRAASPLTKGVASVSATCARPDGSVTALSGDRLAVTSILGGALIGVGLGGAAMLLVAVTGRGRPRTPPGAHGSRDYARPHA